MIRAALAALLLCACPLRPGPAAAQMVRQAPTVLVSSPKPPVTITLTLPQPACAALSPAQWQRVLTVLRRRLSAYAKIYKNGGGRVARSGPCRLAVVAPVIQDAKALATVLARRGQLVIYGMGNLPQYPQGSPFTRATRTRCAAPHAPTPCVVIDGSDLDLRQLGLTHDTLGQLEVSFGTNKAGTPRLAAYTAAHIGGHMAVVLDGRVVADPTSFGAIIGGAAVIANLSVNQAKALAVELGSGESPVALTVASIRR